MKRPPARDLRKRFSAKTDFGREQYATDLQKRRRQYQSVHFGGELDVSLIELMENLGLDDVRLDKIRHLESNGGDYY